MKDNFIFSPIPNKTTINKIEYYCLSPFSDHIVDGGYGTSDQENEHTLAKTINKDNTLMYMIKVSNNNQLFNPFSKLDNEKSYSFLNNVVRKQDKFVYVNKNVLSYYLKFLSTENTAWLNKAERERL